MLLFVDRCRSLRKSIFQNRINAFVVYFNFFPSLCVFAGQAMKLLLREYALRFWLFVYFIVSFVSGGDFFCCCVIFWLHRWSSTKLLHRANDLFVHYFISFSISMFGFFTIHTHIHLSSTGEWYMRTNIFANMFCGYK